MDSNHASVYLDYAASSPVRPEVLAEMSACSREIYANPSSLYTPAYEAKRVLQRARNAFARAIGSQNDEIVFTSGGTESNNLAILGAARAIKRKRHLVVGCTEHHSVIFAARALEKEGFTLSFAPCDSNGRYDPEAAIRLLRDDTALLSLQLANNETGVVQPVAEIARAARARRIPVHCDAVAAFGQIPVDVNQLCADLLSASAHKIGGPKGAGILFVRNEITLIPLVFGGSQERGLRPGTENVPAIAGFAKALSFVHPPADSAARDLLETLLLEHSPEARVNGKAVERLPNVSSVTFPGMSGERLLARLSANGVYASARAACASGVREPSHVLLSMGLSPAEADATLRFSTGYACKLSSIERAANVIDYVLNEQRMRKRPFAKN